MCIRCGECFKACPNNVLQPLGFQQGLEGLWTPHVVADWAGCESSCNACGQVCPTGAIRALPLAEKKVARMGLAIVNQQDLPAVRRAARPASSASMSATRPATTRSSSPASAPRSTPTGSPIEGTGFLAPVVLADKCVGCGLCQTRCYGINVRGRSCCPNRPSSSRPARARKTACSPAPTSPSASRRPPRGRRREGQSRRRLSARFPQVGYALA